MSATAFKRLLEDLGGLNPREYSDRYGVKRATAYRWSKEGVPDKGLETGNVESLERSQREANAARDPLVMVTRQALEMRGEIASAVYDLDVGQLAEVLAYIKPMQARNLAARYPSVVDEILAQRDAEQDHTGADDASRGKSGRRRKPGPGA